MRSTLVEINVENYVKTVGIK